MKNENSTQWHAPYWKEDKHGSAWERVKEAMQRDWTQTKADVHAKTGRELNQNVADTVKQAAGSEAIPAPSQPNPKGAAAWKDVEPAVAYGFGARHQYGNKYQRWDNDLEKTLSNEWDANKTGRKFDEVKPYVRHGWDAKQ